MSYHRNKRSPHLQTTHAFGKVWDPPSDGEGASVRTIEGKEEARLRRVFLASPLSGTDFSPGHIFARLRLRREW